VSSIIDLSRSLAGRFCARLAAVAGDEVVHFRARSATDHPSASINRLELTDAYLADHVAERQVDWSNGDEQLVVDKAISRADVVISSFSAGNFDSPYDDARVRELNPGVVHVIVSPYGLEGPYRTYVSSSLTDWAASGYLYITGEPGKPPLAGPEDMCAYAAGYVAAIAMESGLAQVRVGGSPMTLDISQMEAMLSLHNGTFPRFTAGEVLTRIGLEVGPATYPSDSYPCRNGELFVGIVTDQEWDRFLIAIDRPELAHDPRFATGAARKANADLTDELITSWTLHQDAREAAALLQAEKVPVTECPTPAGLLHDAQLAYRGYFHDVEVPSHGVKAQMPGNVLVTRRLNGAPIADYSIGARQSSQRSSTDDVGDLPLAGITVLDFSIWWAGPMAARTLGDLGANVIRIERPTLPAAGLQWPPWHPFNHELLNRNKRSIVVDLQTPQGLAIVQRLVGRTDVLIQNFRPGVLDRLGLGWKQALEANPLLIYVSLSGYGSEGPKSGWGSYGTLSEAASSVRGLTHYPGEGGMRLGEQLPDGICGLAGVLAALRGLRERRRTNSGCWFDISQLEAYGALIGEKIASASLRQAGFGAVNDEDGALVNGVFRCRGVDEWVAVAIADTEAAREVIASLVRSMGEGLPTDLVNRLEVFALAHTKEEVAGILQAQGIAAFPAASSRDLVADPQVKARQFFMDVSLGDVTGSLPGSPIRSLQHPLTAFRRHAPAAGEHSVEILRDELSLSQGEIERLLLSDVVRQHSDD
jgi:crotonobetainyl-CoA:carnitine CoA-transferase CaiB-like acyl-CoA transferase